jgi:hypothetical protein
LGAKLRGCVEKGDERAVALLNEYKRWIEEPRVSLEKAVVDRFEYGVMSTRRETGPVRTEQVPYNGAEDQHVRPATETIQSPDAGDSTESSGTKDGFLHRRVEADAKADQDMEGGADLGSARHSKD